jgi:hypothetical protein
VFPSPLGVRRDPALPAEHGTLLESLRRVLWTQSEVEDSHLRQAEELYARNPGFASTREALHGLLVLGARQTHERGRPLEAVRYLVRATELWPETAGVWLHLSQYHGQRAAWRDAEGVARRGLNACPDEAPLHVALATALMQQGRDDEAADVLRRFLALRQNPAARGMLASLERELASSGGLARLASAHFSVRFEGQPDHALGKALLQTLEEKHEMLSRILDFEPDGEIQVTLYPKEAFRSVSTAPGWAGGYYSHHDGRIRIGTRDLTAGFVPLDLERTLTHEVTHAFVFFRTRGVAPRDINEGLAQYLSGARLGYRLDVKRTAAPDGRMKVSDFYDAALSFVEFLLDRYRQASMNELLLTMGKTGDVDQAFRRAYGLTYAETRREWIKQLQ